MIVLSTAAEPYIIAHLSDAPQYAYRAQAGTADALLRASQHCNEVRSLVGTHHQDHTAKILGVEAPLLSGGIMCNLDLAKAFDTVPHCDLYFSMVEAQIPEALAGAILHVYVQTVCIIDHGGRRKTAQMHRGIRQGCPLSPIIYACFTARFCRLLDAKLGQGWSGRHMTAFADDTHGFWMLRQVSDFKKAIIELRVMIDTLGSIGMTINFSKSVIAIIMRGNAAAGNLFRQLRGVLRKRGPLTAGYRLRIYKAIVMSSLLYSLNGIGVTAEVVNKLSSIMATHLRKVLRIYEHGVTNLAVLDQDGLQPLQLLHNRALRLQQSIQNDHNRSAALKHLEAKRAHTIVLQIEAHQAQPDGLSIQYVAKEAVCAIECPICGLAYGTPEGLYPCISTIGIRKCSNSPGCTSVAWICTVWSTGLQVLPYSTLRLELAPQAH
eukprot:s3590_g4.t1